uniref:Uncharacterized protein n=1 Tax=Setaria digitata TaxID=48799 RepID=A0A915Q5Z6_9BILA
MTTFHLFIGTLLLPALLVCNISTDRARRIDRDLEQFTSAINGALRLRYGKRSIDSDLSDKIVQLREIEDGNFDSSNVYFYLPMERKKQPSSAQRIVASLNEAERLRFG